MPLWSTGDAPVQNFANYMIAEKCLDSKELDQLFTEFSHIKTYLKSRPNIFDEWNTSQTPIVDRWQNIFAHMKKQSLSFGVFIRMVEYVLVIPGKNLNTLYLNVKFICIKIF